MNCMGHTTHAGLLSRKFNASFTTQWFNWLHHGVVVACIIHHNRHILRNISPWKNVKTAIDIPYFRSHKVSMLTIQRLPCFRQSVLPWAHENQLEAPLHEKWAKKKVNLEGDSYHTVHCFSHNEQQLPEMHNCYWTTKHWGRGWFFPPATTQSVEKVHNCGTKRNERIMYRKHGFGVFNCIFPKSHDSPMNTILFWKRKFGRILLILHHWNKLRFFNLVKRLIACNDPLNERLFKRCLIPWLL